jgi:hypothetical protein
MKAKQILVAGAAALLLCGGAQAATKAEANNAISAAKAAVAAANKAGNSWRDTGKIIKRAESAAAEGNYGQAMTLAQAAQFQGKTAEEQSVEASNSGNPSYLY